MASVATGRPRAGQRSAPQRRIIRRRLGVGRIPRFGLLALTLGGLLGCRGCGCDAPPAEPDAATVDIAPDAVPVAQAMGPDAVERVINEGLRAIAARDDATALARFEAAAAADPGRRVPHQRLCGLYRSAGRVDDARRACSAWRELETEPDFRARADAIIEGLGSP